MLWGPFPLKFSLIQHFLEEVLPSVFYLWSWPAWIPRSLKAFSLLSPFLCNTMGIQNGSENALDSLQRLVHLFPSRLWRKNQICSPCLPSRFCSLSTPVIKFKAQIEKPWKRLTSKSFLSVNNLLEYYVWKTLFCNSISALILELPEPTFRNDIHITFTNNRVKHLQSC